MRVMAIDPGINFGYAIVENGVLTTYGKINTTPNDTIAQRIKQIYRALQDILTNHTPDVILLEELNLSFDRKTRGIYQRVLNRRDLQLYSLAWGIIHTTLMTHNIPVVYIPVSSKKLPKKLAQRFACQLLNKKRIDHNVAEAINWAVNYRR